MRSDAAVLASSYVGRDRMVRSRQWSYVRVISVCGTEMDPIGGINRHSVSAIPQL
jgi:hypothetical protein